MKFDAPAGTNLFDDAKLVGKSTPRIDGPRKTSGQAPYAAERHDVAANQAYGWIVGAGIAKGTIRSMDASAARKAPGVLAVLTAPDTKPVGTSDWNPAPLFGGSDVTHYHQAVALVVAETFEQARAAAGLIRTDYERRWGVRSGTCERKVGNRHRTSGKPTTHKAGDFDSAFADAPVTVDRDTTPPPDEAHAMMEPFATIASWDGRQADAVDIQPDDRVGQEGDCRRSCGMEADDIRVDSPFIGGGFGAKLFVRADAVLAALGAKAVKRPVKIAMQRPLMANNSTHRPATIQRVRLGATKDGRLTAVGHEGWSGNVEGGDPENGVLQTRRLYAGANRIATSYLTRLDLPEGNAMRAPGEAPGHMALEVAMDELAEKLGMDPVALRILNDTQIMPDEPDVQFSDRHLVRCLEEGAERFGWNKRGKPGARRDGNWLVGMGSRRRISRCTDPKIRRTSQTGPGRAAGCGNRHDRHRHRKLHDPGADGGGNDGAGARSRQRPAGRSAIFPPRRVRADNGARPAPPPASMPPAWPYAKRSARNWAWMEPMPNLRMGKSAPTAHPSPSRTQARCRRKPVSSSAISNRITTWVASPGISARSASMSIPAKSVSAACWRCAMPGASSTRYRRAAR